MKINKPFKRDLSTDSKNYGLQLQLEQIAQANTVSAPKQVDQLTVALIS
jgi:hypothetical protein